MVMFASNLFAASLETRYGEVSYFAEQTRFPSDGGRATVAIEIATHDDSYLFWRNPGDARRAPSIRWTLPDGFSASELRFPAPDKLQFSDYHAYGYSGSVILLADITVPPGLTAGEEYEIVGKLRWEVCNNDRCAPDRATLLVALSTGEAISDVAVPSRFAEARNALPADKSWPLNFEVDPEVVTFTLNSADLPDNAQNAYLFVEEQGLVEYHFQSVTQKGKSLTFKLPASFDASDVEETGVVLRYRNPEGDDYRVALTATKVFSPPVLSDGAQNSLGFLEAIFFAFLGGLILNLMPCVFPVLTIKALSLVQHGHSGRMHAIESGALYLAGILVTFTLIAGLMITLRYAGNAVGWGFHLQSPMVVTALGLLMVAIGVNLLGGFEIGTGVVGAGQDLVQGGGGERRKAFFTGLLAVVVATPCMAPFMAGALGYALTQPAAVSIVVFLALGFGLGFPYLALCITPGLRRLLPAPGPWMVTFKNVLAFPMFVTGLWLFWILGRQSGPTSMFVGLLAAASLAFGLWTFGKRADGRFKLIWSCLSVVGVAGSVYAVSLVETYRAPPAAASVAGSAGKLGALPLEHFEPEQIKRYIAEGQPTFVYFTADWCISCKANERVALSTERVADAFKRRGIKVIVGDWTSGDDRISAWLQMYGRAGIPLYLYFPKGSSLETPTILPQILTPDIVVNAIAAADRRPPAPTQSG